MLRFLEKSTLTTHNSRNVQECVLRGDLGVLSEKKVKENHMYFSHISITVQREHKQFSPKHENSTKTLICCVITRKAFMHTKKLYPFVRIVSRTFDHIPGKSACHCV